MLRTIFAFALAAAATALPHHGAFTTEQYEAQWAAFKGTHAKTYSADEHDLRFAVFKDNLEFITYHNTYKYGKSASYDLGLNEFSDMTHQEFKAQMRLGEYSSFMEMANSHSNAACTGADHLLNATMPDQYAKVDWRKEGAVTPIKNQGQCGSCWSFSTTGSTEGVNKIAGNKLVSLSEQQLMDCSKPEGNQGCQGGLMDDAFAYIIKNEGICSEASYPYEGKNGVCKTACTKVVTIDGCADVPTMNEASLAAAVTKNPVSVAIEADKKEFQSYKSGIFDFKGCGVKLDHGVLVVGYGAYQSKEFWTVKNSWGATWGNKGFIYLSRGEEGKAGECGIATQPSYPTKSA